MQTWWLLTRVVVAYTGLLLIEILKELWKSIMCVMISLSLVMPLSVILACFQGHRVWTENSLPCSVCLTGPCVELCLFISVFLIAGFECHKEVSERQYCTLCHLDFICSYSAKCVCVCVCVCVIYCFYFTSLVLYKTCWFNIKACHKTHIWKIRTYVWFKKKNHLQCLCFTCVFCHWKKERRKKENDRLLSLQFVQGRQLFEGSSKM